MRRLPCLHACPNPSRMGRFFSCRADLGLEQIATCMANELRLHAELNSMSAELIERYEELNLVYNTEDQITDFSEASDVLADLLNNCQEYLNVAVAIITLPNKSIYMASDDTDENVEKNALISLSQTRILEEVTRLGEGVVANNTGAAAPYLTAGLAYKVMACPVSDSAGHIDGVLMVANTGDQPDFTNSDRNLLAVMARKATKIVGFCYDPLTNVISRQGFEFCINRRLAACSNSDVTDSVLHINVDKTHLINDTYGQEAGDQVLQAVAAVLTGNTRATDVVARIGGDEFGVLLPQCPIERGAEIAEKLKLKISEIECQWDGRELDLSASIGVAGISSQVDHPDVVLSAADIACTIAKEKGRNRVRVYETADLELAEREKHMRMVGPLKKALATDRFELYGQEIRPIAGPQKDSHLEILLRMLDEKGNTVSPAEFIPAAERYQLMYELDKWVIGHAMEYISEARFGGLFSINLSGQSFHEAGLAKFILQAAQAFNVEPGRVCFEITETAAMENPDMTQAVIRELRAAGFSFSLDDFGSGLSSFGYLKHFEVDYLKIDGSLVKDIAKDTFAEAMVSAISEVGHVMRLKTIAEFVSDDEILQKLKSIGVDYAQGYFIHEPEPLANLSARSTQVQGV